MGRGGYGRGGPPPGMMRGGKLDMWLFAEIFHCLVIVHVTHEFKMQFLIQ